MAKENPIAGSRRSAQIARRRFYSLLAPFLVAAPVLAQEAVPSLSGPADENPPSSQVSFDSLAASIWQEGRGEGFRPGVETFAIGVGGLYGVPILGGIDSHHLALASLSYGRMLGPVRGEGHWYRGNWELRGELFGGAEYYPESEWIVGLSPHLRYNFATGTKWVPFVDLGGGVTATGIGPPDLGGTFEFNLQACIGAHWFIGKQAAITVEARCLHFSSAGIHYPNLGVNGVMGMIGLAFFF